jgi:hypothetical protein
MRLRFADLFATPLARAILVFGTCANFCLLIWRIMASMLITAREQHGACSNCSADQGNKAMWRITILRERIYL